MDRQCTACGETKEITQFSPRSDNPSKARAHCKECVRNSNLVRYHTRKNTRAATKSAGRRYLLKKYGLTEGAYRGMLEAQGGACAICRKTDEAHHFSVDHCHQTQRVRGLLCRRCNSGIGHLQDSPDLLRMAIHYLEGTTNA